MLLHIPSLGCHWNPLKCKERKGHLGAVNPYDTCHINERTVHKQKSKTFSSPVISKCSLRLEVNVLK